MAKFKFPAAIKSFDELPEEVRPLAESVYDKDGDEFVFQGLDEIPLKKKVDEFRETNRKYHHRIKELEKMEAKYKEIGDDFDPDRYQAGLKALEEVNRLRDKKLLDEGKLEEVVKARTSEMNAQYEKQLRAKDMTLKQLEEERNRYKTRLDEHLIDGLVQRVATKVGTPKKNAMTHLLNYGRQVWKLNKEGQPVAFHPGTSDIWYGKDSNPITEEEWGGKLLEDCSFMFEAGQGGGSKGGTTDEGVRSDGNVKYIDRHNSKLMSKYAKEILDGTVVPVG